MMTLEFLKTRELSELRVLYEQHVGSKPHHKKKAETLAIDIIQALPQDMKQPDSHDAQEDVKEPVQVLEAEIIPNNWNTHEDIRGVSHGVRVSFEGDTWHAQNGAAMDSGHVSMPLSVIEKKIKLLRRPFAPATVVIDGQEVLAT